MVSKKLSEGSDGKTPDKKPSERRPMVSKESQAIYEQNKTRKKPGPKKGTRPSGRQKGTPNKASQKIADRVNEYLRERGYPTTFDPAFVLAEMIADEQRKKRPNKDRIILIAGKLMPYYHPARKAIEFEPTTEDLPVLRVVLSDEGQDTGKSNA